MVTVAGPWWCWRAPAVVRGVSRAASPLLGCPAMDEADRPRPRGLDRRSLGVMGRRSTVAIVGLSVSLALVHSSPVGAAEVGDSVVGSGVGTSEGERWTFRVDTRATPSEGVEGSLRVKVHTRDPGTEQFRVDVGCLEVSGNLALVGGRSIRPERYAGPHIYSHIVFVVVDTSAGPDTWATNRFINWPDNEDPCLFTLGFLPYILMDTIDSGDFIVSDGA
jgi:hypothetical protein